jgi:hypothetical protein
MHLEKHIHLISFLLITCYMVFRKFVYAMICNVKYTMMTRFVKYAVNNLLSFCLFPANL